MFFLNAQERIAGPWDIYVLSLIPGGMKMHSLHCQLANIYIFKGGRTEIGGKEGTASPTPSPNLSIHRYTFYCSDTPGMRGRASLTQFREQNPQRTWGLIQLSHALVI